MKLHKVTIYRDDSTTQVVRSMVKHYFWTSGNSVLTLAVVDDISSGSHHYEHWLRERVCWFKVEGMEEGK